MVPEARLEQTEHGLLPAGTGWFVVNARDAEWRVWEGRGKWPRLAGATPTFRQLGVNLVVLEPGQPLSLYHWERDQEDFLVLYGEALAIVEGEERALRSWDLLHCPPGTKHTIIGAGDRPCVVLAVGARANTTCCTDEGITNAEDWGAYAVDETALRRGAGVAAATNDKRAANPTFARRISARYRDGWLP